MTVSRVAGGGDALARVQRENETLYAVIKTVSSSLDLRRVLDGIVEIATDATNCHAAFIYFVERDRVELRAASKSYSHLVGTLGWGIDEGLTGWVARTKTPEFIRDNAMGDPRMKYVPELEEEHFQSMVAVPVLAQRDGDVIGVIVLHTEAPREFDDGVLNFLVHTASLVAGAIENAKLYEGTRRRVDALTTLTQLSQALAAVTLREDLYDAVTRGARQLIGADSCQIWRIDPDADELELAGSDPPDGADRPARAAQLMALMRGGRSGAVEDELLIAPLAAGDEQLGLLVCIAHERAFDDEDAELLRAVAHQTAVGLKKAELIERLTAENIVKDMFEALAAGSVEAAEAKAAEARCDLTRPHVFIHAVRAPSADDDGPAWPELAAQFESRLRRLYPRAFFDSRHDCVRAIAPLPTAGAAAVERLRQGCEELAHGQAWWWGSATWTAAPRARAAGCARRPTRPASAARWSRTGGAVSYEGLGAYKYLVHLELDDAPHDRYRQSVEELIEYDRRRGAALVETLERFLADRGSVAASARALYIHPNTVRQRLERIERVTGLDLGKEDLLSLELALKLARLHDVRGDRE